MFRRSQTPGRTAEQLLLMRRAGLLVGQTLEMLRGEVRPGVTTLALDALAEDFIRSHGGDPELPARPRLRAYPLHERQRRGGPRHPVGVPGASRGRPGVGRLRRRARGLERRRRLLGRRRRPRRRSPGGPAPHRRHRGRPLGRHHRAASSAAACMRWARRSRRASSPRVPPTDASTGSSRSTSGTRSGGPCTRTRRSPTTRCATAGPTVRAGFTGAIEPMVTLGSPCDPGARPTTGRSPPTDGSRAAHWEHSVAVTEAGLTVLTAVDGGAARLGDAYVGID